VTEITTKTVLSFWSGSVSSGSKICLLILSLYAPFTLAQTGSIDLVCTGSNTATFSPPLVLMERSTEIYAEGEYTTCLSVSNPSITSGTYTADGTGNLSCISGAHAGNYTIDWNTNEHSTISFTNSIALRPLGEVVVVATGAVVSGKFLGDNYTGTFTLFNTTPLECLFGGVSETTGPTSLMLTTP